jgi:hypothetical protein
MINKDTCCGVPLEDWSKEKLAERITMLHESWEELLKENKRLKSGLLNLLNAEVVK